LMHGHRSLGAVAWVGCNAPQPHVNNMSGLFV
jgi:hypothetical protein